MSTPQVTFNSADFTPTSKSLQISKLKNWSKHHPSPKVVQFKLTHHAAQHLLSQRWVCLYSVSAAQLSGPSAVVLGRWSADRSVQQDMMEALLFPLRLCLLQLQLGLTSNSKRDSLSILCHDYSLTEQAGPGLSRKHDILQYSTSEAKSRRWLYQPKYSSK